MNSLRELQALRGKMVSKSRQDVSEGKIKILVGMATCGIAAGARPVMTAFSEGILSGDHILREVGQGRRGNKRPLPPTGQASASTPHTVPCLGLCTGLHCA